MQYIIDNFYAMYSNSFDSASKYAAQAAAIAHGHKWKGKEAYALMLQGVVFYLTSDPENALPKYLRAFAIFDSLQDHRGLAKVSNELAVFHRKHTGAEKALMYLDIAEVNASAIHDQTDLGTAYGHRAVILDGQGKVDEAFKLYEKVYEIRLNEKDSVGLGYVLLDLSSMALRKGDLEKSLTLIEQSTRIRKNIGDRQGVAVNLVNTGETYYSVKNFPKAIEYFKSCLEEATAIGYTDLVRYTFEQLASAYANIGDYKNAFIYQQRGKVYSDSLFTIERTKVLADLQTKYESDKKDHQILLQRAELRQMYTTIAALAILILAIVVILLLARNRHKREQLLLLKESELSIQEAYNLASVQSQEMERRRFAQDLHDGMGQLISALRLALISVHHDSTLEERVNVVGKAEKLLNEMHQEIRTIAFNLMPQTLVHHGLVPALREMADRVNQSGKITIRIQSFDLPERLSEVREISLYRIVQEWVNNVIKYSMATTIEVQLIGYENEINVMIEDNGDGFDPAVLNRSAGNGWKNMHSRMNLVKGSIDIDSKNGIRGTTLILKIPLTTQTHREQIAQIAR